MLRLSPVDGKCENVKKLMIIFCFFLELKQTKLTVNWSTPLLNFTYQKKFPSQGVSISVPWVRLFFLVEKFVSVRNPFGQETIFLGPGQSFSQLVLYVAPVFCQGLQMWGRIHAFSHSPYKYLTQIEDSSNLQVGLPSHIFFLRKVYLFAV